MPYSPAASARNTKRLSLVVSTASVEGCGTETGPTSVTNTAPTGLPVLASTTCPAIVPSARGGVVGACCATSAAMKRSVVFQSGGHCDE